MVQVRLPCFEATYPTLHVDPHLWSVFSDVKSIYKSRFGYSQINPRSQLLPVRIRGRAPEAQVGWCQSKLVLVVVVFLVFFCYFFVFFFFTGDSGGDAVSRRSRSLKAWRASCPAPRRHGETDTHTQHVPRTSDQTEGRESQYLRTYQARAAMGLPLSAVKIRRLTEKTTLTRLSNKL